MSKQQGSFKLQITETKQEQAYRQLKNLIITGQLPENKLLVERQLSEALGISRTPIRAALNELCADGLIVNYPGKGMMVAPVTIEDVLEIYQMRIVLDEMAFRMILEENAPGIIREMNDHVEQMKKHIDAGEYPACVEHDMAFHDCYYLNVRNQRLSKILFSLRDQIRRFLHFTADDRTRIPLTYEEHKRIMEAVRAGDTDLACERLVYHLQQARGYHLNRLQNVLNFEK